MLAQSTPLIECGDRATDHDRALLSADSRAAAQVVDRMTTNVAILGLVITVATFVGSLAAVAFILVRLPATYFHDKHHHGWWTNRHPILRWSALILKNLWGAMLVGIGFLMLFTPGQGLLTILIGIMLLDFPGKRTLERKLLSQPRVYQGVNRLRARFGRPPIIVGEQVLRPSQSTESRY